LAASTGDALEALVAAVGIAVAGATPVKVATLDLDLLAFARSLLLDAGNAFVVRFAVDAGGVEVTGAVVYEAGSTHHAVLTVVGGVALVRAIAVVGAIDLRAGGARRANEDPEREGESSEVKKWRLQDHGVLSWLVARAGLSGRGAEQKGHSPNSAPTSSIR
jgi:hypothetical protein